MYTLRLEFDQLPQSLNKALRSNWRKAHRINTAWDLMVRQKVAGRLPVVPLERARIQIVRHYYRTLDFDGLVGSLKPVVDGLVSCGVIKDDSWTTLGPWQVDQKFRPKSAGPLLEIYLNGDCA